MQLKRMCSHLLTAAALGCLSGRTGRRCCRQSSVSQPSGDRGRPGALGVRVGGVEVRSSRVGGIGPGTEHGRKHTWFISQNQDRKHHRTSNFKAPDQLQRDQACWQKPTAPSWFLRPHCLWADSVSRTEIVFLAL